MNLERHFVTSASVRQMYSLRRHAVIHRASHLSLMIPTTFCFYPNYLPRIPSLPLRVQKPSHPYISRRISQSLQLKSHALYSHTPSTMHPSRATNTAPFSSFFTSYFLSHHPDIANHLRPQQTALAAAVYLFRFSPRLSNSFVADTLSSIARAIAEVSGKSVAESSRLFATAARKASHVYFGEGWDNVSTFVAANAPVLLDLQKRHAKIQAISNALESGEAPEVNPVLLHALLDRRQPLVVFVFANYCSVCKAVRPIVQAVAKEKVDGVQFVMINGPMSPQFKVNYEVTAFPTLLRFEGPDKIYAFPNRHPMTKENIVAFARGDMLEQLDDVHEVSDCESDDVITDRSEASPRQSRATKWAGVLKRQGIDQWEMLSTERNEILSSRIESAIHCGSASSCVIKEPETHSSENDASPPLCVLLGGGMGAGKTTVINLISSTQFWKRYGDGIVVVEADAFKMTDPLFQVLANVTPLASRIVHHDSLEAAEELFVKAVNCRRSIVFDGTLSWSEYARQTIEMLRDTEYLYKRGPGYQKGDGGDVTEKYWERAEKRSVPVEPYNIELVGVTADAEISVMRGIVRRITDGRGVSVPDQLHSHVLFSRNFDDYVDMADAVYLFDTTTNSSIPDEKPSYAERLVALKPGILFGDPAAAEETQSNDKASFVVRDPDAYERFLKKKKLNVMASSTEELYSDSTE